MAGRPAGLDCGTDLHRDVLRGALSDRGVEPVRPVAPDAVWSTLRFGPA